MSPAVRALIADIDADLDTIEAGQARLGALFARILADDESLWPVSGERVLIEAAAACPDAGGGSWRRFGRARG